MPQLILLLIIVIVVLPLAVAKLVLDYRARGESRAGDVTLTVAELERLVRRYVEEATEPLHERIRRLERALDAREENRSAESSPGDQPLIDDPSLEDDDLRIDDGGGEPPEGMA